GLSNPTGTQYASAHNNPTGCTTDGVGISLGAFWDSAGTNSVIVLHQSDSGRTIYFVGALGHGARASDCAYEGGTVQITNPDGTTHNVTPGGGVACIGGTAVDVAPFPCTTQVTSQDTNASAYVVNFADAPFGDFHAQVGYSGGHSHHNTGDTPLVSAS